jgi:pimeloyl-ACP methyl ester carboxylesterase
VPFIFFLRSTAKQTGTKFSNCCNLRNEVALAISSNLGFEVLDSMKSKRRKEMNHRFTVKVFSVPLILLALIAITLPGVAQQVITGTVADGSLFEFDVPANWNGDLVVYAHGIFDPQAALVLPSQDTASDFHLVLPELLNRGYAVASSSWSSNGYAVKDGVERTHQLSGLFVARVGLPNRTLVLGKSLGSLVVAKLVERYPGQYNGVLATCGPLGGGTPEIKYLADERILFDYFFPGVLQGDAFHTPTVDFSPGSPTFNQVLAALVTGFSDGRTQQFFATAHLQVNPFDPPNQIPTEIITSGLTGAGFSVRFTNDLLNHTHGHIPYDNTQVQYSGSLDDNALNAGVERFTASPDAVQYLETYYDPTGQISLPFLTLHTIADPQVPFFHEGLYATKVSDAGASDHLVQQSVTRYGHCNFKVAEIMNSFDALANWVANPSQKPSGGDVTIP